MPEYHYRCGECGHEVMIRHRASDGRPRECLYCGAEMHKVPQAVRVNWGGVPLHPNIKQMIDDAPRRRDEYEAIHHD